MMVRKLLLDFFHTIILPSPRLCPGCGEGFCYEEWVDFCSICLSAVPLPSEPLPCRYSPPLSKVWAVARQGGLWDEMVYRLEEGEGELARPLGQLMAQTILFCPLHEQIDFVLPVSGKGSEHTAFLLGREVALHLNLPLWRRTMSRADQTILLLATSSLSHLQARALQCVDQGVKNMYGVVLAQPEGSGVPEKI